MAACAWWQLNSAEVPLLQKLGMKLTSLCCDSGAAERKVYKGICTKERSRLGQLKKKTFAEIVDDTNIDVDEEDKETQTTATKLAHLR